MHEEQAAAPPPFKQRPDVSSEGPLLKTLKFCLYFSGSCQYLSKSAAVFLSSLPTLAGTDCLRLVQYTK
jgi:hypothetical protein